MINLRERKLIALLSLLLWLWAVKGTVGLYRSWQETLHLLAGGNSAPVAETTEPETRLLEKLLALEGRGLPWPEKEAGVNVLDFLRRKAQEAGLTVNKMNLAPSRKVGPHKRLPVQLEFTGSAADYLVFLYDLAQGEYACNASELELSAQEDGLRGRVALEFFLLDDRVLASQKKKLLPRAGEIRQERLQPLAYYYPQGLARAFAQRRTKPESQVATPENLPPAPLPPVEAEPKEKVTVAPYKPEYQLLGIVYQKERPMALLRSASGETLLVGEGARVKAGELVVKIEQKSVLLRRGGQEARLHVAL
jgi:hypothetical protein